MATKNTKKSTKEIAPIKEKTEKVLSLADVKLGGRQILIQPLVTEKAALYAETKNSYVFEVSKDANKKQIAKAIFDAYKVKPTMVRTTAIRAKDVFIRGKWGVKSGGKKAYVYLKEGDKIEFV